MDLLPTRLSLEELGLVERCLPKRQGLVRRIADGIGPGIAQAVENGARRAVAESGLAIAWDIYDPGVTQWLHEYILVLAGQVAETTINRIRSELIEGMEAGETLQRLRDRVQEAMGPIASRYRAYMIAATETQRATSAGREMQYKAAGYGEKTWRASADACPFCAALDGYTVAIEQAFFEQGNQITVEADQGEMHMRLDYSDTPHPPLHPWCRCETEYN